MKTSKVLGKKSSVHATGNNVTNKTLGLTDLVNQQIKSNNNVVDIVCVLDGTLCKHLQARKKVIWTYFAYRHLESLVEVLFETLI